MLAYPETSNYSIMTHGFSGIHFTSMFLYSRICELNAPINWEIQRQLIQTRKFAKPTLHSTILHIFKCIFKIELIASK